MQVTSYLLADAQATATPATDTSGLQQGSSGTLQAPYGENLQLPGSGDTLNQPSTQQTLQVAGGQSINPPTDYTSIGTFLLIVIVAVTAVYLLLPKDKS